MGAVFKLSCSSSSVSFPSQVLPCTQHPPSLCPLVLSFDQNGRWRHCLCSACHSFSHLSSSHPNLLSLKFLFCSLRLSPTFPLLSFLYKILSMLHVFWGVQRRTWGETLNFDVNCSHEKSLDRDPPASHSPRQCRLSQGAWPVACNTWVHIKRIYIMHHIEILGRFHLPGRSPNRGLCWGSGGIGQLPIPGKGQGKDSTWCSCPQIEPLRFIASCTTSVHCLQPSTSLFWPAT